MTLHSSSGAAESPFTLSKNAIHKVDALNNNNNNNEKDNNEIKLCT